MIGPENGRPYWNPYKAGLALGVVVTSAFLAGKWFGASGFFARAAAALVGKGKGLDHWMSFEVGGLFLGGLIGALIAGRFKAGVARGSHVGRGARLLLAVFGGVLVMIGSRFAAGCTSGLALTGGIRMSTGAFVFMGAMFGGGFLAAAVARRIWS